MCKKTSHAHMSALSYSSSLWHKRLGHALLEVIKKYELLIHLKGGAHYHCIVFPLAKQTKFPFQLSTTMSIFAFDLLHCDIWDPIMVRDSLSL